MAREIFYYALIANSLVRLVLDNTQEKKRLIMEEKLNEMITRRMWESICDIPLSRGVIEMKDQLGLTSIRILSDMKIDPNVTLKEWINYQSW